MIQFTDFVGNYSYQVLSYKRLIFISFFVNFISFHLFYLRYLINLIEKIRIYVQDFHYYYYYCLKLIRENEIIRQVMGVNWYEPTFEIKFTQLLNFRRQIKNYPFILYKQRKSSQASYVDFYVSAFGPFF